MAKPDQSPVYHDRAAAPAYEPVRAARRRVLERELTAVFRRHAATCPRCGAGS